MVHLWGNNDLGDLIGHDDHTRSSLRDSAPLPVCLYTPKIMSILFERFAQILVETIWSPKNIGGDMSIPSICKPTPSLSGKINTPVIHLAPGVMI